MSSSKDNLEAFIVPEGYYRIRADKVVADHFDKLSRTYLQKIFESGKVHLGDKIINKKECLSTGDRIQIWLPEAENSQLTPLPFNLRILYEDEELIAIDKPPGLVVHPGNGKNERTLVQCLLSYCTLSHLGGEKRPGIVHRLDKDTSGVIVLAKSNPAYLGLIQAFAKRQVIKHYFAFVKGIPNLKGGSIKLAIGRDPQKRIRMAVTSNGRFAHTEWWLIKTYGSNALLECRIYTGRTHQIRVHLSHMGHPILGDYTYGCPRQHGFPDPQRPLLHAHRLSFTHPITGKVLTLESPLPSDFTVFLV